jgi:replicative DNA helicase
LQTFDPSLETRILKTLLDQKAGNLLTTLNQEWFGMPTTQEIWHRIEVLRKNGKPIPSSETLSSDPVLSEAAQTLLKGQGNRVLDAGEIEHTLDQLDKLRKGRLIFKMLHQVTDLCKTNDADLGKAQNEIEKCLQQIQSPSLEQELLSYGFENERALDLYESLMNRDVNEQFIQTGYTAIDAQQGGLSRGRVYTIGAPSGGGKSTLANNMAINIYRKSLKSVGYWSFEMNREECLLRTQANITRIPNDRFQLKKLSADERKKSDKALVQFLMHGEKHGVRLDYHCPSRDINIIDLFAQAENLNYDVIICDYINLMAPINPRDKLWENIGEAFRLAKRFAEKTQKIIIMIVQIDEDTGAIKYAKSIKHHSDGVWTWKWSDTEKETGQIEVDQVKLRNFKPISFPLQAEFEFCAFTEAPAGAVFSASGPSPKPMNLNS